MYQSFLLKVIEKGKILFDESELKEIFCRILRIEENYLDLVDNKNTITWDSLATMLLISEIEENFHIMLETEDLLKLDSYKKFKEIIQVYKKNEI